MCVAQYHDTVVYEILRREIHKKPFKVDLRIHGVPQDAVLDDRERMSKIQEMVDMLRTGHQTESSMADLGKKGEIQQVQRSIKTYSLTLEKT